MTREDIERDLREADTSFLRDMAESMDAFPKQEIPGGVTSRLRKIAERIQSRAA